MDQLTEEQLNQSFIGIFSGVKQAYLFPPTNRKEPQKEVVEEAKTDLERILNETSKDDNRVAVLRLRKYLEIVDLLIGIPENDLLKKQEFREFIFSLYVFAGNYHSSFSWFLQGDTTRGLNFMVPAKYSLISERAKLLNETLMDEVMGSGSNGTAKKLIMLADKYLELLKIGQAKPDNALPYS